MSASLFGWGAAVGASLLVGAIAGAYLRLPESVTGAVTAFGGGVLLASVAFELVPEADELADVDLTAGGLGAGTLAYIAADWWLSREPSSAAMRRVLHATKSGRRVAKPVSAGVARGESIAAGLFADGVPESVALGLTIAEGEIGLALLVGILVGNVVEAYGAAQPIVAGGRSRRFAIGLLGTLGLSVAGAVLLGGTVLAAASDSLVGFFEALAAGAVLGMVTISIVPHAFQEVSRWVAAATVAGFVAGYLIE
jgi:ZIP family zinc transporter